MIEEKKHVYESMKKKVDNIRSLIDRNRLKQQKKCIGFPFMVIEPSNKNGTKLDLQLQKDSKKLSLVSNYDMTIHGDLEIVSLIEDAKVNNLF